MPNKQINVSHRSLCCSQNVLQVVSMQKYTQLKFLFLVVTLLLSTRATYGFGLYPIRIARELQPGQSFTQVVTVDNAGSSETTRIDISTVDWVMNEHGKIGFPHSGESPHSISSCITYSPAQMTLGPGERKSMRITVSLPGDATPGEHIGGLSATERTIPHKAQALTQKISVAMGIQRIYVLPIVITVGGGKEQKATIESFDTQQSNTEQGYLAAIKINNPSNIRIEPQLTIILKDANNKEVFVSKPTSYLILRETNRNIATALPKELSGHFTLVAKLDQGHSFTILEAQKSVELQPIVEKAKSQPALTPKAAPASSAGITK